MSVFLVSGTAHRSTYEHDVNGVLTEKNEHYVYAHLHIATSREEAMGQGYEALYREVPKCDRWSDHEIFVRPKLTPEELALLQANI